MVLHIKRTGTHQDTGTQLRSPIVHKAAPGSKWNPELGVKFKEVELRYLHPEEPYVRGTNREVHGKQSR